MLCTYFAVQLSSLCVAEAYDEDAPGRRVFCAMVLGVALLASLPVAYLAGTVLGRPVPPPKHGLVDGLARYLGSELREGDTVQPLDWTGGAVHAMLIARAKLATPFLYDFYFYYDVSNPYVKELRRKLIDGLRTSHPRFIIDVLEDKRWVSGPDTSLDFPELRDELANHYLVVHRDDDVMVYERLR
jgi:hypothetical protein